MLADAKILMKSAPSAFRRRTSSRIESGARRALLIGWSDVRMRDPGVGPVAMKSRRSLSSGEPGLWIVVTPDVSVAKAFATIANIDCTGVSPSLGVWYRPARLKYQLTCAWPSIRPG